MMSIYNIFHNILHTMYFIYIYNIRMHWTCLVKGKTFILTYKFKTIFKSKWKALAWHFETSNLQRFLRVHFLLAVYLLWAWGSTFKSSLFLQWDSLTGNLIFIWSVNNWRSLLDYDGTRCPLFLSAMGSCQVQTQVGLFTLPQSLWILFPYNKLI